MRMHIVLAGFGNMGRALARGWLDAESSGYTITAIDSDAAARERARELGLKAPDAIADIAAPIDVAVLAVKPGQIEAVLAELPRAKLYLSIAAGRTLADIERLVGADAAVIRAMPNTPAAIGQGVTGLCANANASGDDRAAATALMRAVGTVEWLDDEGQIDAVTAVSGSGPAYVFLLIEALTAAAIDAGLEPDMARRIATATVSGAGAYAVESGRDAATLRREVTSPKGTTEAALRVLLEKDAFARLLLKAVRAAAARSRELGAARTS